MKLKQWDIVWLKAIDHTTAEDGWTTVAKAMKEEPELVEVVGFLVGWDNDVIRLTNAQISHGDIATNWIVPRGCIKDLRLLKPSRTSIKV